MEIIVLGVGDAFTTRFFNTSFLVRHEGFTLAIDCPDRYLGVLEATGKKTGLNLPLSSVNAFLITHLHGDHVNGLEATAFYSRFRENKKLVLWAQPRVLEDLWPKRLRVSMEPLYNGTEWCSNSCEDYFTFNELKVGESTRIGPFSVESYLTLHHLPASALKITVGSATFGYSCDTKFDPKLIEFLSPANLIFHETNIGPGHTAYEELAALPEVIRNRMRLVHYPDNFEKESSVIACAEDGEFFSL